MAYGNQQNSNQQQGKEEEPKVNLLDLQRYLRATAERDLVNLDYIIHGTTLTILLSNFDTEEELKRAFKNNYSALMSLIGLDNIHVEIDVGYGTIPLTLKMLKDISGISL